ncbi:MAG TPA: tyrosine-type recombinase/integrase [Streptosporangiaceae bacterium]
MQGSIYPYCNCRDPSTGKPYRRAKGPDGRYTSDCPRWNERGHKLWGYVVNTHKLAPGRWEYRRKQAFATRKAAEEALADVIGDVRAGTALSAAQRRITVGEWADMWMAGKVDLRPSSARSYSLAIDHYIRPALGRITLSELSAENIDAMLGRMRSGRLRPPVNRRGADGKLTARTVNHVFGILRAMLATAVKRHRLTWNPCSAVELESAERHEAAVWSPADADAFLAYVADAEPAWAAIAYRLALKFGLRRGEIAALRWMDLDGEALMVRRNAVAVGSEVIIGAPKSRKGERSIPLAADPGMAAALRAERKRQIQARLAAGPDWTETGLIVADEHGAMVPPWLLSEMFARLAKQAGLTPIRLHEARHTAGSIWREAGIDFKVIQEWLGHATMAITTDVYSHVRPAAHDAAAAKAAAYWAAQSGARTTPT